MSERPLTDGERALLSSVFGPNINLDALTITTDRALPRQNVPVTPNGRIYWPKDLPKHSYSDDFSTVQGALRGQFLHEAEHAWEAQHGVDVYGQGANLRNPFLKFFGEPPKYGVNGNPYDMSRVPPDARFDDLNLEQRAEVLRFIYQLENDIDSPDATMSLDDYRAIYNKRSPKYDSDTSSFAPPPLVPERHNNRAPGGEADGPYHALLQPMALAAAAEPSFFSLPSATAPAPTPPFNAPGSTSDDFATFGLLSPVWWGAR